MPRKRSRRDGFIRRTYLAGSASTTAIPLAAGTSGATARRKEPAPQETGKLQLALKINGHEHRLALDPRTALLDALREGIGLTGTKKGCDHGQCGACTVHLDGRSVLSCLTLAVSAQGHDVTTIEGLSDPNGALHAMQQAFIDQDALQCGYCTPGQIMSAIACVNAGQANSPPASDCTRWTWPRIRPIVPTFPTAGLAGQHDRSPLCT